MITYVHRVRGAKRGVVRPCSSSQIPPTMIKLIIFCADRSKDIVRGATSAAQGSGNLRPRGALWKIGIAYCIYLLIVGYCKFALRMPPWRRIFFCPLSNIGPLRPMGHNLFLRLLSTTPLIYLV